MLEVFFFTLQLCSEHNPDLKQTFASTRYYSYKPGFVLSNDSLSCETLNISVGSWIANITPSCVDGIPGITRPVTIVGECVCVCVPASVCVCVCVRACVHECMCVRGVCGYFVYIHAYMCKPHAIIIPLQRTHPLAT